MKPKLEIACFDIDSAFIAADHHVDRIELTTQYALGGTTPSLHDFIRLKSYTSIPIVPLIRCRGGNFVYTKAEVEEMKTSIIQFADAGAEGIVIGCLTAQSELHQLQAEEFKKCAPHLPFTFHRAFDQISDYKKTVQQLINFGYQRILSSGCSSSALEGIEQLNNLIHYSNNEIEIIVGGGIRSSNITAIKEQIKAPFFHSACITDTTEKINQDELSLLIQLLQK